VNPSTTANTKNVAAVFGAIRYSRIATARVAYTQKSSHFIR
jgi:hypothetical protein